VAAGGAISKKHQKWKKGLLISGIVTFIFLILLIIYYFMTKKSCNGTCSF